MHGTVMDYVKEAVDKYDLSEKSVLELGSLDINGSVREYFIGAYVGTDIQSGPGVDHVIDAHDLHHKGNAFINQFEVVISTEMLEHDSLPWVSMYNARKAVRPPGYLIVTARGYDERGVFGVHEHPEDNWRFSVSGMRHMLEWCNWSVLDCRQDPDVPGVFATAIADD